MTLPSSGLIGFLDIQNEFGGDAPIDLGEYYGAAAGIPGSGTISISQFYGKSAYHTTSRTRFLGQIDGLVLLIIPVL